MNSAGISQPFNKKILSAAISTAFSVGVGLSSISVSQADTYDFSFSGLFTMLDSAGVPLQNTSYPYYGDTTWGYGFRTQISGTLSFDTATGSGSGTVAPFEFFKGGPAVATGVQFQSLGGMSTLLLGNMGFAWNGSDITTQIVLDGSGLFTAIGSGAATVVTSTFDLASCLLGGSGCVLPASDGAKKGNIPIGPVPIAILFCNSIVHCIYSTFLSNFMIKTN